MSEDNLMDRPTTLQRRRPRPASDEHIDPVDYKAPAAPADVSPAPASVNDATKASDSGSSPVPVRRGPGRPRRQPTIQVGIRIDLEVTTLLDKLVALDDSTNRAVIEEALREYARSRNVQ